MKNNLPILTFYEAKKGKSECIFCFPYQGMEVLETKNFRVLADTFPLVSGHMMITSKAHYSCAGELSVELQPELISLKNIIGDRFKEKKIKIIFYEHGRSGCCLATKIDKLNCEHFHLHCLPINISIADLLEEKFRSISLESYADLQYYFFCHGNYLFFEDPNQNLFFYPTSDQHVAPHLLRTLISNKIGFPNKADWEKYKNSKSWLESINFINKEINFKTYIQDNNDLFR